MGQNNGRQHSSVPNIHEWKQHPTLKDVYCHSESKLQVQKHIFELSKKQEELTFKRSKEHHIYVRRILFCESLLKKEDSQSTPSILNIFVERVSQLRKEDWKPVQTALAILKGFRRLSGYFGFFEIHKNMIGLNGLGEVRVWIQQDPIYLRPDYQLQSQSQMIDSLSKIIVENDPQTAMHLINAKTFHDVINNILIQMSKESASSTRRQNEINQRRIEQIKNKQKKFLQFPLKKKRLSTMNQNNSQSIQRKGQKSHFYQNGKNKTLINELKNDERCFNYNSTHAFFLTKEKRIDQPQLSKRVGMMQIQKCEKQQKVGRKNTRASSNNLRKGQYNKTEGKIEGYFSYSASPEKRNKTKKQRSSVKTNLLELLKFNKIKRKHGKTLSNICEEDQNDQANEEKSLNQQQDEQSSSHQSKSARHLKKLLAPNTNKREEGKLRERERETDIIPTHRQSSLEDEEYEQRKKIKQDFTKKLKVQFGEILSFRDTGETSKNTDSKKDLLVEEKINKKKETFAELKKEVSSLLKNQLKL